MSAESNNTNLGDISVDNEVIKNIALKAATDIQGIRKIRGGVIKRSWNKLTKRDSAEGVKLEFKSTLEIKITLNLIVDYGVNIPDVTSTVQESVKKVVEHMTSLTVTEVAVRIIGIQTKNDITLKEKPEEEFVKL